MKSTKTSKTSRNCCPIPQRIILIIMCFLSFVILNSIKGSIVIILYEMTFHMKNMFIGNVCIRTKDEDKDKGMVEPSVITHIISARYRWSTSLQQSIHVAFNWGQMLTAIPSGIIADKFGGKWILALCLIFSGFLSMLTPLIILRYDYTGFIITRLLIGCCYGCATPAVNSLLSRWIPFNERSRSGAIIYSGMIIGYQLGYTMPIIIKQNFNTLLPIYYFWGLCAIFWFTIFVIFCYNDPISHPFIHQSEVEYLEYDLVDLNVDRKNLNIPWNEILFSTPMRAYYIAILGHSWGYNILLLVVPKYYSDVLRYTYQEKLFHKTFTYTFMIFTSIIPGFLCDWMIKEKMMDVTLSRKLCTIIASAGPAIFLIFASYADCYATSANVLFTMSILLFGPWYAGMKLNALDLAPNYSGTIIGISYVLSTIISILVTPISSIITSKNLMYEWRQLFWITFSILCFSAVYVGIAASGRVQDWNDPGFKKDEEKRIQEQQLFT